MPNMLHGRNTNTHFSFSLSGGKRYDNNNMCATPNKIKILKDKILNDYLIPLYTKQWKVLKENIFFIQEIEKKINIFHKKYKLDELTIYIDLLKVMNILVDYYKLIEFEEEKNKGKNNANEIMSMIYQTTMIKLLPEYEIYNSILGKPKKELNQVYNTSTIQTIKELLAKEDITYYKIKKTITGLL